MKEKERIKLSQFAKQQGISYQSAWKMWEKGLIEGIKLESGTILVSGWARSESEDPRAVIYVRVNEKNAETLPQLLKEAREYCEERNYDIIDTVTEILPGINYDKTKLIEILHRDNWDTLVVPDKRAITYLGYDVFEAALGGQRKVEQINDVDVDEKIMIDLFQKILVWSKQIIGMGQQKKAIFDLMNKINY